MLLSSGFPPLIAFFPPTQLPPESFQPVKGQSVAGTGVGLRLPLVGWRKGASRRKGPVWRFEALCVRLMTYLCLMSNPFEEELITSFPKDSERICMYIETYPSGGSLEDCLVYTVCWRWEGFLVAGAYLRIEAGQGSISWRRLQSGMGDMGSVFA
jgi:hypothetical protein